MNAVLSKRDNTILKNTVSMAWPAILESFFIALAGMVDSYMVSTLGSHAVAAVGLTTQPKFVGLAIFIAMNVSVSALVARRRGEQRREDANALVVTGISVVIVLSLIISLIMVLGADSIIRWCGSTEQTHAGAVEYFRIIMGGMIFTSLSMAINSAQRGSGNTRITMRTNITSNFLNVIFNYILINGKLGFPAMGIRGAALATVLGTVVACVMSIHSVSGEETFISIRLIWKNRIRPSVTALVHLVKVGYGVFFEQLLMRVGFMMTALMAANQGDGAMAAHQVGMNVLSLSFAFGDGLQSAAVALIGRSLGEKNPDLAKQYGQTCRRVGAVISVILAVIFFAGARPLYSLFFAEEEIVKIGIDIMYVVIFIVVLQISQVIYMGCLRGAGDTLYTAVASMVSVTLMRTLVSYIGGYVLGWGIVGIWLGIVADQLTRFILGSIRFNMGKWTKIKI